MKRYYEPPFEIKPAPVYEPGAWPSKIIGYVAAVVDVDGYHITDGLNGKLFPTPEEVEEALGDQSRRLEMKDFAKGEDPRARGDFKVWAGFDQRAYYQAILN